MANLDSTSIPTFKILALGMRGSGKTVFLASMYHFLSAYRENRGYFLSCPDERKSADLLEKFGEISDSDDWPEGNSTLDEYVFDCCYLKPNNNGFYQVSLIRTHGPNRAGRAT
jgi:GTPase SAR1 family protein